MNVCNECDRAACTLRGANIESCKIKARAGAMDRSHAVIPAGEIVRLTAALATERTAREKAEGERDEAVRACRAWSESEASAVRGLSTLRTQVADLTRKRDNLLACLEAHGQVAVEQERAVIRAEDEAVALRAQVASLTVERDRMRNRWQQAMTLRMHLERTHGGWTSVWPDNRRTWEDGDTPEAAFDAAVAREAG